MAYNSGYIYWSIYNANIWERIETKYLIFGFDSDSKYTQVQFFSFYFWKIKKNQWIILHIFSSKVIYKYIQWINYTCDHTSDVAWPGRALLHKPHWLFSRRLSHLSCHQCFSLHKTRSIRNRTMILHLIAIYTEQHKQFWSFVLFLASPELAVLRGKTLTLTMTHLMVRLTWFSFPMSIYSQHFFFHSFGSRWKLCRISSKFRRK